MQDLDLPLFFISKPILTESTLNKKNQQSQNHSSNPLKSFDNALKDIFQQNTEENVVIKTRRILGERAKTLTDEQIHCTVTEFQFLINTWLDEFERDVFNGMTLKEVLNEK